MEDLMHPCRAQLRCFSDGPDGCSFGMSLADCFVSCLSRRPRLLRGAADGTRRRCRHLTFTFFPVVIWKDSPVVVVMRVWLPRCRSMVATVTSRPTHSPSSQKTAPIVSPGRSSPYLLLISIPVVKQT